LSRHLLVIGGQRCGTTYLAGLLEAHPDIAMARPQRPEPKVFLSPELAARGLAWYEARYFAHATSESLLGEKSTSYLDMAESADRAQAVLGRAEIVAQLRDPVARAISNWRLSTQYGLEERPLAVALTESLERHREWDPSVTSASPFAYLERGRYIDLLEPWFRAFPGSVHITFLEDLVDRAESVHDLCASLGVDPDRLPDDTVAAVNRSSGEYPPDLEPELLRRLHDYFDDSDERLAARLGRRPPWAAQPRNAVHSRYCGSMLPKTSSAEG
jgi:hypothetical protein